MFRHLRIAILPLLVVLVLIHSGMADGLPMQSRILTVPTGEHLFLVSSLEKCRNACIARYKNCAENAIANSAGNHQQYTVLERVCAIAMTNCYDRCE